jgi:hypothetical protein
MDASSEDRDDLLDPSNHSKKDAASSETVEKEDREVVTINHLPSTTEPQHKEATVRRR